MLASLALLAALAQAPAPATDLVRIDAASGRASVLVPAASLVPVGASQPLDPEDYDWSPDHSRLLIFTTPATVGGISCGLIRLTRLGAEAETLD